MSGKNEDEKNHENQAEDKNYMSLGMSLGMCIKKK